MSQGHQRGQASGSILIASEAEAMVHEQTLGFVKRTTAEPGPPQWQGHVFGGPGTGGWLIFFVRVGGPGIGVSSILLLRFGGPGNGVGSSLLLRLLVRLWWVWHGGWLRFTSPFACPLWGPMAGPPKRVKQN